MSSRWEGGAETQEELFSALTTRSCCGLRSERSSQASWRRRRGRAGARLVVGAEERHDAVDDQDAEGALILEDSDEVRERALELVRGSHARGDDLRAGARRGGGRTAREGEEGRAAGGVAGSGVVRRRRAAGSEMPATA